MRKVLHVFGWLAGIAILFFAVLVVVFRPSHDRVWELGQEGLPRFVFSGDEQVSIENFRNFDWTGKKEAKVRYETRTFALSALETVDVFISHFDDFEGLAHIFLSFGFTDGEHAVVSLETRREYDEKFSPLLGLLRQFEIIYVVGSEEDLVGVRTGPRDERVYLYPTKATPAQARQLFLKLAEDINAVYETPRMYNTLTHNCTNELTRRVEDISDVRFPYTWKTILPGYFDEVLYRIGIIANDASFAEIKARHEIHNERVDSHRATFSKDLRQKNDVEYDAKLDAE